jgi:hypothetical protein
MVGDSIIQQINRGINSCGKRANNLGIRNQARQRIRNGLRATNLLDQTIDQSRPNNHTRNTTSR